MFTIGSHALANGCLFSSLQSSIDPNIQTLAPPPHSYSFPQPDESLEYLSGIHWIHPQLLHLSLIPSGLRSPQLRLLRCIGDWQSMNPKHQVGFSKSQQAWRMERRAMRDWKVLEASLSAFIKALFAVAQVEREQVVWPSVFRYDANHPSEQAARDAATKACQAFCFPLALITYGLLFVHRLEKSGTNWKRTLIETHQIHPQMIDDVESSVCGDFNAPRLGGIINPQFLRSDTVDLLRQVNAPVFLYWGAGPLVVAEPCLQVYAPPPSIISSLRNLEAQSFQPLTPPPAPVTPFSVEKDSAQRPGEHFKDFFARRSRHNNMRQKIETEDERKARMARLENAKKGGVPGKKGARVYHWYLDDNDNRIRRPAGRKNYEHYWMSTYKNRRRYDPHKDEWDVCSDFETDDCMTDPGYYSDEDEDRFFDDPLPTSAPDIPAPSHQSAPWSLPRTSLPDPVPPPLNPTPPLVHPPLNPVPPLPNPVPPPLDPVHPPLNPASPLPNPMPPLPDPVHPPLNLAPPLPNPAPPPLAPVPPPLDSIPPPLDPVPVSDPTPPLLNPTTPPLLNPTTPPLLNPTTPPLLNPTTPPLLNPTTPPLLNPTPLSLDPSELTKAQLSQTHDDAGTDSHVHFADHEIRPIDFAHWRYGINILDPPPPKKQRVFVESHHYLLGHGQFDTTTWGGEDQCWTLQSRFQSLLSVAPSTSPSVSDVWDYDGVHSRIGLHLHLEYQAVDGTSVFFLTCLDPAGYAPDEVVLKLSSALDVLEVFRRRWDESGIALVARHLCQRGIPFSACLRLDRAPSTDLSLPEVTARSVAHIGLGYRPEDYTPDENDYRAYECQRDHFLQSHRGQLALHHGGLLGRLALGAISFDVAYFIPELTSAAKSVTTLSGTCWYEELSIDELHLVCGVYHIDTGTNAPIPVPTYPDVHVVGVYPDQVRLCSWWPLPHHWNKLALNLGFWSRDCEAWYLQKLNAQPCLRQGSWWRNYLKSQRRSLRHDYQVLMKQADDSLNIR
jgi:hypothetical protein